MPEDEMILRRRLKSDGKSMASINDISVSIGLLRKVGDLLSKFRGSLRGVACSTHQPMGHSLTVLLDIMIYGQGKQGWEEWNAARKALAAAERRWTRQWLTKTGCVMHWTAGPTGPRAGEEEN